ncbi:MAG TPA: TnsA endonuclease N-terminal domain-containing protein [Pseudomonadales bacterium]|nr:TnsA endonuclease N-terminal domain-containing protein [Pseudomonadales bacterium]
MNFTVIHPTNKSDGVRGRLSSALVITGFVPMQCGHSVRYEGLNERMYLESLDFNPTVKSVWPQPLSFKFADQPGKYKYTPDFLVEFSPQNGEQPLSPMLVEVKAKQELMAEKNNLLPGFRAATEYCREQGWRFRIVTDCYLKRPYAKNIRFLSHYLRNAYDQNIATRLKLTLRQLGVIPIAQLLEASFADAEDRLLALGVTWHLIATRNFGISLLTPISTDSLIWEAHHGKA